MLADQPIFSHVRQMISIILGLAIATLLTGLFEFRDQRSSRLPWLHIGWALVVVLESIVFWWWEFRLSLITTWNFGTYFFVLAYSMLFYALARILFPPDLTDGDSHDSYFMRSRRWFFGFLLVSIAADLWDTHIKGAAYMKELGARYFIHNGFGAIVCIIGMATANRAVQWTLLVTTLGYEVIYVVTMYNHL